MSVCCCSLAGTAACKYCSNNPNAERPPVVSTFITTATDQVLISGKMTNGDKIRSMTDEELATWLARETTEAGRVVTEEKYKWRLDWLKQEVEG